MGSSKSEDSLRSLEATWEDLWESICKLIGLIYCTQERSITSVALFYEQLDQSYGRNRWWYLPWKKLKPCYALQIANQSWESCSEYSAPLETLYVLTGTIVYCLALGNPIIIIYEGLWNLVAKIGVVSLCLIYIQNVKTTQNINVPFKFEL